MRLCRILAPGLGPRLCIEADGEVRDLTVVEPVLFGTLAGFLGWTTRCKRLAMDISPYVAAAPRLCRWDQLEPGTGPGRRLLKPTDAQEVWGAGVTYQRSRQAREEESGASRLYDRVYEAPRPELFFKATPGRTVGPGEPVRVRGDSRWTVPEPELALVLNSSLQIVGYTLANDLTARDVEAENALYLPQAKIYDGCCALGPAILLADGAPSASGITVGCRVMRGGSIIFEAEAGVSRLRRSFAEMAEYLGRDNSFPDGVVLMTGTGVVPPDGLALADGDIVEVMADVLGVLRNPVRQRTQADI